MLANLDGEDVTACELMIDYNYLHSQKGGNTTKPHNYRVYYTSLPRMFTDAMNVNGPQKLGNLRQKVQAI